MLSLAAGSFDLRRVFATARAFVLAFAFLGAGLAQPAPAFSDARAGLATAEREPLAVPAKPAWSAPVATAERAAPPVFDPPGVDSIAAVFVASLSVPAATVAAAPIPFAAVRAASLSLPPDSTGPPSA